LRGISNNTRRRRATWIAAGPGLRLSVRSSSTGLNSTPIRSLRASASSTRSISGPLASWAWTGTAISV
jgi:hypothetical protein